MSEDNSRRSELERAKEILAAHREMLMGKANVVGVGVGLKQVGEKYTATIALIVLVTHKVPADELADGDLIPEEIEGIPVDVQVTGQLLAQSQET